jgi:putative ATP-dependent endonuclease of OLD family
MGLQITQIRVKNFRSIESLDVKLTQNNVVLGQNNCGKSNLLRAVNIALTPNPTVSEEDIFVAHGESLTKDKATLEASITAKNNEIATLNSSIDALNTEKASLTARVGELEASITAKDINTDAATKDAQPLVIVEVEAN